MSLFPDQTDFVGRIRAEYRAGVRAVLGQAGTAFGKTHTAAEGIIAPAIAKGHSVVFVAGLDSIVRDTHAKLAGAGLHAGLVQAGRVSDPHAPVQVCMQQTLHIREERPPGHLVILDEAHHAAAGTVRAILESYPQAWLLGLTAVPQRADGRPLDIFQRLVCGPSNAQLTEWGRLAPCELLSPGTATDGKLALDPVTAYERYTPGTRAIVFASNIGHAEVIASNFAERGIPAATLLGTTSGDERDRLRAAVTAGDVKALIGVGVFVEGFDLPAIETVILARPFTVTGGFLQAIGRGRRLSPSTGKTKCVVLDLAGSVFLHGLPDEPRVWALDGDAVRRVDTIMALARCAECFAVYKPTSHCPRCGASPSKAARIPRVLSRAEKLERFDAVPPVERDRRYLARLQQVAETRMRMPTGRAAQWARRRFTKQFRRAPMSEAA